jgi:hypothetical protein
MKARRVVCIIPANPYRTILNESKNISECLQTHREHVHLEQLLPWNLTFKKKIICPFFAVFNHIIIITLFFFLNAKWGPPRLVSRALLLLLLLMEEREGTMHTLGFLAATCLDCIQIFRVIVLLCFNFRMHNKCIFAFNNGQERTDK